MKMKWYVIFSILGGLIFQSLFNTQSVYASCTGTYTCGVIPCNAASCSDGSGAGSCVVNNLGVSCGNGGTCICTSDGSCTANSNPVACSPSSNSNNCYDNSRGCVIRGNCSCTGPTPTPGPPGPGSKVNCSNLSVSGGSSTLTMGQTYTIGANYDPLTNNTSIGYHNVTILGGTDCNNHVYFNQENGGVSSSSFNWTPAATGTYTIMCGTAKAAYGACSGYPNCVGQNAADNWTDYACGGPNAYMTVNVVDATNGACSNPDAHYTCASGTSANNVSGTSAWTWNCNGSGGGTNAFCSENKPSPSTCSITINPASVVNGTAGQTAVTFTGSVSGAAPAQNVRLFLERRDGQQVPGGASSLSSSDGNISEWGPSIGKYYYEVARCAASSGGSCNESQTIAAPPGQYYFHCDVASAPGACSGNPFCSYEGLGGTIDCSSGHTPPDWVSCSTTDNGTFNVVPPPSCTLALTATPTSIAVGETSALSTTILPTNGTISSVNFVSGTPANVTVSPTTDPYSPYATTATGVSSGNSTVTATAIMNDGVTTCTGNSTVTINNSDPWWQVVDGDVSTNGDINSSVPPSATTPYFDGIGSGGYPGIPAYGGVTNLTGANVSVRGWLANSGYNPAPTKVYNSAYFLNAIPSDLIPAQIPENSEPGNYFLSGGTRDSQGYDWYKYDGTTGGPSFSITSAANLAGRKVILIVKDANVSLNANITRTVGSGFFMLITTGNVTVDTGVGGGAAPNLEGIFVSDGEFRTGTAVTQLWIRGTVAAYGGMRLQRDLGALNYTTPAEFFEFAPDLVLLFPRTLGIRPMSWQEVAP